MSTKIKVKLDKVSFSKLEIKMSGKFNKQEKDQIEAILKNNHFYTIEEAQALLKIEQRRVVK